MYQTAVHRGERLEFAPVEKVEQPEFSKEEGREGERNNQRSLCQCEQLVCDPINSF